MNLKATATTLVLLCAAGPAAAQQTDNQQILQLLQGLNGKLDRMEQRIDKLEQQNAAPAAQSAPAANGVSTTPAVAPAAPAKIASPGWQVELYPLTKNGVQDLSTARTHMPIGPTMFKLSLKSDVAASFVQYRGRAFFKVTDAGKYGFRMAVTDTSGRDVQLAIPEQVCTIEVKLDDRVIVPEVRKRTSFSATGSADLQQGTYELGYTVTCKPPYAQADDTPGSRTVERLEAIQFNVQVIGPDDNDFRDFEPAELFTVSNK